MELILERGEDDVLILEGFFVDRSGIVFFVFFFGDLYFFKGVEGGKDRVFGVEGI